MKPLLIALAVSIYATQATAQMSCFTSKQEAVEKFKEIRGDSIKEVMRGDDAYGGVMSIFQDGEEWALLVTHADGNACLYTTGSNFQMAPFGDPI
jgi:hypothetical protein